ncbi:MAG: thioredoxin-disulfide reductase [Chloroflexi bacterium]|nr:thioredoxin-disulfide reductase [Chloroflexota bacterium]
MGARDYDIIIVGGGCAGLAAAIYTSRARLRTLLIEKEVGVGGQIVTTNHVENYPGFPEGITGYDLTQAMRRQAVKYGMETLAAEVSGLVPGEFTKVLRTTAGEHTARAVIIASGAAHQHLGVPGERELAGKGVSYCATCDGPFFREQRVAVVGGGDAAVTEAGFLTHFATKVYLIHRRDQLRAQQINQERVFADPCIEVIWDTLVTAIEGDEEVKALHLHHVKTHEESVLEVAGVFVSIGFRPNSGFLRGVLKLDPNGHIITNEVMETDVPGIFAAGDIRLNSGRQAITAAGDGATAAIMAERYVSALRASRPATLYI